MEREEKCGKKNERESEREERDQGEKMINKKLGVWEKIKKRVTKTFGKAATSEERKSEKDRKREQNERERMFGNFVDQLLSESDTERKKELKKKNHVSICDQVIVKNTNWIRRAVG